MAFQNGIAPAVQFIFDSGRRSVSELAAGAAQEAGVRNHCDDALRPLQRSVKVSCYANLSLPIASEKRPKSKHGGLLEQPSTSWTKPVEAMGPDLA